MARAAILDVDGTLVDTNYHHAIAWYRAFRQHEIVLPVWRIHRHIGMGGDQLVQRARRRGGGGGAGRRHPGGGEGALHGADRGGRAPRGRARPDRDLKDDGHAVVLASSAKPDEVDHYLDLLDARELVDDWTTSGDVEATKPEPDLVQAAMEKAGTGGRR